MNSKFWTIVKEVFRKNVKSVAFLVMVFLPLLIGLVIYVIARVANDGTGDVDRIAVVTKNKEIGSALTDVKGNIKYEVLDRAAADRKLKDEDVGAILALDTDQGKISSTLETTRSLDTATQMTVSQTLTAIQQSVFATQLGLSPDEKTNLLSPAKLEPMHVEFDADGNRIQGTDYSGLRQVIATVLIVMIWIFVATYGSIVAQEIASEKGTRIMEVILSSVKAETHFYGKLVGIILVCSVNVLAYVVQIGVGYLLFRDNDMIRSFLNGLNLQEVFTGQFWLVIPIVILGILLFTFLAALSGSLISRVEDVPKAQTPMTMIGLLGYMLSVIFASQPDNIVMTVTSYIPFISSFVLPMQIATGVASNLQVWISMGIMFVTMLFILLFSARLYKSNVLIYSSDGLLKVLKQSLNNIRNEDKLKNKA
ncbi:ABC transporter permease [Lactococcus formosensis]|uniref:ABC transporter permease n=1 Tax=Lactococcus formosensis TaxID=1281486 RepID=A0A9X4NVZ1_9LACT|nr:ABC transporter permease [Lactococcus formosensis]MDG6112072.1 ABC transporter permease [Lactococcus formosensis]MDG6112670.1 ABC transporter permease [Lactococcus formosensis]MDG6115320.1 ABC transporter permease [Lactococcus formosensis]MDG6118272.1 ABC transporter permease [Lactococcus formosensis]MDG6121471.1 ABC transporter permease [Lactococcus formosensis]